jgi:hypothetical protein
MSIRFFKRLFSFSACSVAALAVIVALALPKFATADTYNIDFNDGPGHPGGNNWQTLYVQGFNTSLGANPAPALNTGDPVYLSQFQFYKSGMADSASNIQLAILNNIFPSSPTVNNTTTTSPTLVGLSTNTIASTAGINTGDPITFTFNNLPLTFGTDYAAVFVNVGTDTGSGAPLTPVLVSSLASDYALNPSDNAFHPVNNYGTESQFNYSTSNFISGSGFFNSFGFAGDADFTATLNTAVPEPASLLLLAGALGLVSLGWRARQSEQQ